MKKIILDEATYKIAKKKKCIYASYENIIEGINPKDKVLITNGFKEKKRKVKNVYEAKNLDELKTKLNKKIYPINLEDRNEKVCAIEFKSSPKIIEKLLIVLLAVVILLLGINLIKIKVKDHYTKQQLKEINKIKEDEISYAFIEINPKMLLELKGDIVIDRACLNEDCLTIFDSLDIKNEKIGNAINLLYNKAKEEGINVTNGVKVSSTNNNIQENIEKIDYIKYSKINKEEEQKMLTEVIDNKGIVNSNNKKSYNEQLLDTYKKDKDYGNLYTCNINNNELSCYITESFYNELGKDPESISDIISQVDLVAQFMSILDKFEIKYETTGIQGAEIIGLNKPTLYKIYLNGDYRSWGNVSISQNTISIDGNAGNNYNYSAKAAIKLDDYDLGEAMLHGYGYHVLPLNKLNLIDSSYNESDIITLNK